MDFPHCPGFDLTGKRALVVGASSGIGLACAAALAQHGAEVTLAARSTNKLNDICEAMTERDWLVSALTLDVTKIEQTASAVKKAGPFDILINSAGLARHSKAIDTKLEDYDTVTDINVKGAYFLARTVAAGLLDAGKPGSLITISSQMAHVGGMDRAVYCATKHAVEGFTKAMAIEWGKAGIRINTICPTFILTPLSKVTFDNPASRAWVEEKIKLSRVGELEDIMGPAVFLASDASALITGTSLIVDGGWIAG